MYAPFFGLQHPPFSIAPDPRYLFMSERHREALAHLLYGLDAGGGFVLLTGEVGAGKTTVCRCFLEQIPEHCNVAYIFNPKLTVGELLRSICDEFGVPHKAAVPGHETVKDCIDPLNASLLAAHAAGRNNVLIIDEAQNLEADVLEQLRLLTNLETSERKLLQIILIGQPELRNMVARPSLEQLAQRVIARFHLDALSPQETQQYIAHRLAVAGLHGPVPFSRRALRRVHALSRGIPRRINLLCDRALLGAYAAGTREVSTAIVERAAREVFGAPVAASGAAATPNAKGAAPLGGGRSGRGGWGCHRGCCRLGPERASLAGPTRCGGASGHASGGTAAQCVQHRVDPTSSSDLCPRFAICCRTGASGLCGIGRSGACRLVRTAAVSAGAAVQRCVGLAGPGVGLGRDAARWGRRLHHAAARRTALLPQPPCGAEPDPPDRPSRAAHAVPLGGG